MHVVQTRFKRDFPRKKGAEDDLPKEERVRLQFERLLGSRIKASTCDGPNGGEAYADAIGRRVSRQKYKDWFNKVRDEALK